MSVYDLQNSFKSHIGVRKMSLFLRRFFRRSTHIKIYYISIVYTTYRNASGPKRVVDLI